MKRTQRILLTLALTLVLAFGITSPVLADGPVYGDTVPAGTVIDRDIILVGREVSIAGTVNGNVLVLGNQVELSGTVDGSLVVAGQNVLLDGTVTGAVYAGALTVGLGPDAVLGRDLNTVTVSLVSASGSAIGRDLNAIGLDSGLNGHVGRDLHTVVGPIQLYNGLMRLLGFDELTLELHFDLPAPEGNGSLPDASRRLRVQSAQEEPFDWGVWALDRVRLWGVLFILGVIALWQARRAGERSGGQLLARPWKALGTGLLALVLAVALFAAGLLAFVLAFAIGLGFNFLGLWQLTVAIWFIAAAVLALFLVALWLFIVYGSKLIVIYALSAWAFDALFRKKAVWLDALALLAGTLVYALLVAIPYAGWTIGVLVTAAGMGAAHLAWRERRRPARRPGKVAGRAGKRSPRGPTSA
jgi:cytoskeletal protein CcmA (bactofilin family)